MEVKGESPLLNIVAITPLLNLQTKDFIVNFDLSASLSEEMVRRTGKSKENISPFYLP